MGHAINGRGHLGQEAKTPPLFRDISWLVLRIKAIRR